MSLVSVVIPTFNSARYVVEAVQSALDQTYSKLEVVVVNDGSTDRTEDALRPFADKIKYIFQENQGAAAARNTGIRNASGEWIAFLDGDDLWHPEKIAVQLAGINRFESVGLVGSPACEHLPESLAFDPEVRVLRVRDFISSSPVTSSSTLVRRSVFSEVGPFDTSLKNVEDLDMWMRITARFTALQVLSPCWTYRRHANQKSRNSDRMYRGHRAVLRKFFKDHPSFDDLQPPAWGQLYLHTAISRLEEARRVEAIAFLVRSMWCNPGRLDRAAVGVRRKLLVRAAIGDPLFHRLKPKSVKPGRPTTA